jgi:hypothetical protein
MRGEAPHATCDAQSDWRSTASHDFRCTQEAAAHQRLADGGAPTAAVAAHAARRATRANAALPRCGRCEACATAAGAAPRRCLAVRAAAAAAAGHAGAQVPPGDWQGYRHTCAVCGQPACRALGRAGTAVHPAARRVTLHAVPATSMRPALPRRIFGLADADFCAVARCLPPRAHAHLRCMVLRLLPRRWLCWASGRWARTSPSSGRSTRTGTRAQAPSQREGATSASCAGLHPAPSCCAHRSSASPECRRSRARARGKELVWHAGARDRHLCLLHGFMRRACSASGCCSGLPCGGRARDKPLVPVALSQGAERGRGGPQGLGDGLRVAAAAPHGALRGR